MFTYPTVCLRVRFQWEQEIVKVLSDFDWKKNLAPKQKLLESFSKHQIWSQNYLSGLTVTALQHCKSSFEKKYFTLK